MLEKGKQGKYREQMDFFEEGSLNKKAAKICGFFNYFMLYLILCQPERLEHVRFSYELAMSKTFWMTQYIDFLVL